MSDARKALVLTAAAVQFVRLGAALWNLRRRDASLVRGPKRLWRGVVFVNWAGPIAYFTVGRKG